MMAIVLVHRSMSKPLVLLRKLIARFHLAQGKHKRLRDSALDVDGEVRLSLHHALTCICIRHPLPPPQIAYCALLFPRQLPLTSRCMPERRFRWCATRFGLARSRPSVSQMEMLDTVGNRSAALCWSGCETSTETSAIHSWSGLYSRSWEFRHGECVAVHVGILFSSFGMRRV
jgi:hypothetical protein